MSSINFAFKLVAKDKIKQLLISHTKIKENVKLVQSFLTRFFRDTPKRQLILDNLGFMNEFCCQHLVGIYREIKAFKKSIYIRVSCWEDESLISSKFKLVRWVIAFFSVNCKFSHKLGIN